MILDKHPCHLYYDIDYKYKDNPTQDVGSSTEKHTDEVLSKKKGKEIVVEIIEKSKEMLTKEFGESEFDVIHLKTKSSVKFSRHIIIRAKNYAFIDNMHVKEFVYNLVSDNDVYRKVIDLGVYSRNRCFRLAFSVKMGKDQDEALVDFSGTMSRMPVAPYEFFERTLISNVEKKTKLVGFDYIKSKRKKIDSSLRNLVHVEDIERCKCIEDFALANFASNGVIRKVIYNHVFNTLMLSVGKCRYCRNIQREHKSNHIYILCKLDSGVIVQRCHDPCCRGFESTSVKIPDEILEKTKEIYCKKRNESSSMAHPDDSNVTIIGSDKNLNDSHKRFSYLSSSSSDSDIV